MGPVDHPDQGHDAHSLQGRHHRERRRARSTSTVFILASIATRGVRFGVEALLLRVYGEPIRAFIEKRLNQLTWIFLACLIGGFVAVRFIF